MLVIDILDILPSGIRIRLDSKMQHELIGNAIKIMKSRKALYKALKMRRGAFYYLENGVTRPTLEIINKNN